jgi:hypothetical protein
MRSALPWPHEQKKKKIESLKTLLYDQPTFETKK